ncbi:putative serine/threonine-protein kinase fhkC [Fusarium oxysporum f. sp. albedinis]|nr:putative serine/threonine-protein kinase fhkC [Fusarium oxysporum f. sp. albedinis]
MNRRKLEDTEPTARPLKLFLLPLHHLQPPLPPLSSLFPSPPLFSLTFYQFHPDKSPSASDLRPAPQLERGIASPDLDPALDNSVARSSVVACLITFSPYTPGLNKQSTSASRSLVETSTSPPKVNCRT